MRPAGRGDRRSLRVPHGTRSVHLMVDAVVDDQLCRPVTADEVEHLNEHGGVQLKRFVHPDVIGQMLAVARANMGDDGDRNPMSRSVTATVAEGGAAIQYFKPGERGGGKEWVRT